MPKEEFRRLQMIELKMLLYFDDFCKQHNLRYYMAGGTLIGAIRHQGFIPWDEDIDVHMPRPDYDRLPSLWKEFANTQKYTLCVTDKEKNFRHHVYAISDNETTLIEERTVNDDIPQGVRMDILPYDGVPGNRLKAAIQFFWAIVFSIYNVQRLPENQGGRLMRLCVGLALKLVRKPETRYKIWAYAQKKMSQYDFDGSCPWVRELASPLRSMKFKYPRKDFDVPVYFVFEKHSIPAHHYYKQYLDNVYPGYMELPPEDKRTQKTKAVFIDLDTGYEAYKGIYYCKEQQGDKKA